MDQKNEPNIFENTDYFLCSNDYLIFKLCGEIATDYLNALKYHYDNANNTYPTLLLKKLDVSADKLPKVMPNSIQVVSILTDVSNKIVTKSNTKVILTSYDAICSFIGSGVNKEFDASDVSSTVTVCRMLSKYTNLSSDKIYITPFNQDNSNIIGCSNNLGGIIFLPYLLGERAPIWNDNVRGMFFGLERMHTKKDMIRPVFESTAFIDMSFFEEISKIGIKINSIRVSGGLSRINTISQIKADVLESIKTNRDFKI